MIDQNILICMTTQMNDLLHGKRVIKFNSRVCYTMSDTFLEKSINTIYRGASVPHPYKKEPFIMLVRCRSSSQVNTIQTLFEAKSSQLLTNYYISNISNAFSRSSSSFEFFFWTIILLSIVFHTSIQIPSKNHSFYLLNNIRFESVCVFLNIPTIKCVL